MKIERLKKYTLVVSLTISLFSTNAALSVEESIGNAPIRDKWALVIGIGKYQNPRVPQLKFAGKDARDFRNYLVNEAHFAPDHVRLLLDDKATQRRVLSELGNKFLARVAKPEDLVVIYVSSHGSPAQADIRGRNFVVAYDSDPDDLFTTGIEMDKILESVDARVLSKRVLLVLDACHSGVVTPGAKGIARSGNFDAEQLAQGSGQLVITSSSPEQQSWESKRYQNGIFTRKLLDGLRMKGERTTLGEAFPFIENSVMSETQEDYASRQTPVLKSKWNGNELVLAAPAAAPQAIPITVIQILEPDSTIQKLVPHPVPSSDKYSKAVALYNKGDYASCIELLNQLIKSKADNTADAHFTLANAYAKVNKIPEAINHYKESFRLGPHGKKADYCLQMISYYSKNAGHVYRGSATATQNTSAQVSVRGSSANSPVVAESLAPAASSESRAINAQADKIRSSLPRIIMAKKITPSLSEVLSWSLQERASYDSEAAARVEHAQQLVNDGGALLKRVQSLSYSLIPNNKSCDETDAAFASRRKLGEVQYQELLIPYKTEIEKRNRILADETAILQACESARRELTPTAVFTPNSNKNSNTNNCKY